jgi:hypothetical protein
MITADKASFVNRSATVSFEGSVRIADDLSIEIDFANDSKLLEKFASLQNNSEQTGTVTDDGYFYAAMVVEGKRVQVNDILLATRPSATDTGLRFHSKVDLLTYSDQAPSDILELELNVGSEQLVAAMGMLADSFDTIDFGTVEILPGTDAGNCHLRSQLKTGIPFPETKILEVVRFLSGIEVQWIEAKVAGKRMVRAPKAPLYSNPDLSPMPQGDRASAIKMFDAVAAFVGTNTGKHTSSETDTLANLRQARPSLVNFRLILGAAVEHLLKRFPGKVSVGSDTLQHIDESLFTIDNAGLHPSIKEKLKSALVNQRNLQPKHVLAAMKALGLVETSHIKTYENIRNMGSQGDPSSLKEANDTLRKASIVLDLVYRILLNGISYSGKYRSPIKSSDVTVKSLVVA